jgi:hypothetical protein
MNSPLHLDDLREVSLSQMHTVVSVQSQHRLESTVLPSIRTYTGRLLNSSPHFVARYQELFPQVSQAQLQALSPQKQQQQQQLQQQKQKQREQDEERERAAKRLQQENDQFKHQIQQQQQQQQQTRQEQPKPPLQVPVHLAPVQVAPQPVQQLPPLDSVPARLGPQKLNPVPVTNNNFDNINKHNFNTPVAQLMGSVHNNEASNVVVSQPKKRDLDNFNYNSNDFTDQQDEHAMLHHQKKTFYRRQKLADGTLDTAYTFTGNAALDRIKYQHPTLDNSLPKEGYYFFTMMGILVMLLWACRLHGKLRPNHFGPATPLWRKIFCSSGAVLFGVAVLTLAIGLAIVIAAVMGFVLLVFQW